MLLLVDSTFTKEERNVVQGTARDVEQKIHSVSADAKRKFSPVRAEFMSQILGDMYHDWFGKLEFNEQAKKDEIVYYGTDVNSYCRQFNGFLSSDISTIEKKLNQIWKKAELDKNEQKYCDQPAEIGTYVTPELYGKGYCRPEDF
ncbi:hypothetical protein AAA420_12730 [Lactobacillus crispatus]|uniref:hypothetical protein n=1 Tax=Lactobacillus crispatus TaxID=47770 RepID=UPI0030FD1DED